MFQRLNVTIPISRGIHYYANERGVYFPISWRYLIQHKVEVDGFVIGVLESRLLRPIYDINHRMVVVRLRDQMNIPVDPFDVPKFPFHRQFSSVINPL